MSAATIATKMAKAKRLGIEFAEDYTPKETELDELIEAKQKLVDQGKDEARIAKAEQKKADEEARKTQVILKDVDGDDVDQSEYFWPRTVVEILNEKTPNEKKLQPTDQTAPPYFKKMIGMPVDREELIKVFLGAFPRSKGFLFYKKRDSEVYIIIVPLKYAMTIGASNESRPGDFQKHALSFISEGSVNVDSLKMKLDRVAKHSTISPTPIER